MIENGSGVASLTCLPASASIVTVGTTSVNCTATDRAVNVGTSRFAVTVTPAADGRMFGDGFINQRSLHRHFVFRVDQLKNQDHGRLEYWVNDPRRCGSDDDVDRDSGLDGDHDGGYGRDHRNPTSHFEALTISAVFSDDPRFQPGRGPNRSIDTVRLYGTGRWNGRSGYTFEATATDQGEPGRGRDTFALTIKDPQGNVVDTLSGTLDGGNVQSTRLGK